MILKVWHRLVNTECVVVKIGDDIVYPIFKNASTNLIKIADQTFVNEEINKFDLITVFIRDPSERFTSGVNKYCNINNLEIKDAVDKISAGELVDRHFAPQWVWLLHLHKYHKKKVLLKPLSSVKEICKLTNLKEDKQFVMVPREFVEVDQRLMQYIGEAMDLGLLIKECKIVLS